MLESLHLSTLQKSEIIQTISLLLSQTIVSCAVHDNVTLCVLEK